LKLDRLILLSGIIAPEYQDKLRIIRVPAPSSGFLPPDCSHSLKITGLDKRWMESLQFVFQGLLHTFTL